MTSRVRAHSTTPTQRDEAVKMYVKGELVKDIVHYTGLSTFTLYKELAMRGIAKRNPDSGSGRPRKYDCD